MVVVAMIGLMIVLTIVFSLGLCCRLSWRCVGAGVYLARHRANVVGRHPKDALANGSSPSPRLAREMNVKPAMTARVTSSPRNT